MRLDLTERLRCPRSHVATPLVVVTTSVVGRDLRHGVAGCPVCRLEAKVVDGAVVFGESIDGPHDATPHVDAARRESTWAPAIDRLIALLGLAEPGGHVLLTGRYADVAGELARAADVSVVVMWLSREHAVDDGVGVVRGVRAAVPFTEATFRAAALDLPSVVGETVGGAPVADAVAALAADAVRSVAVGGRVVGTTSLVRPDGLTELARDATEWVAERQAVSAPVELRRGYSSPS